MIREVGAVKKGGIEFHAFLSIMKKLREYIETEEDVLDAFRWKKNTKKSLFIIVCFSRMFDVKGTGRVSVAELREVLTSLGEKLTEDEVEELFSEGEIGNAALRTSHV